MLPCASLPRAFLNHHEESFLLRSSLEDICVSMGVRYNKSRQPPLNTVNEASLRHPPNSRNRCFENPNTKKMHLTRRVGCGGVESEW
ncbi:hypothetical protein PoB_006315900 [Plakobranchus ocellatus]|uniref:Uncharacterized protein n=1 Tax=Plakobranchus ocellatus TaxID=259542 RepID=A0AAV4CXN3_9GAST|nr:hypothetical protein PoB_006315900 [Plakobranchus ocellatus]